VDPRAAGLTSTIAVWGLFAARRGRAAASSPGQVRRIRISGAYQPSEVHVRTGEPARLIFRREETAPCSERVVFPDFGMSVTLPPYQDVAVDLPASEPGAHEFTCELEMLHGRVVVDREAVAR
jgi:plastocyanin domain-containing protein